MFVTLARRAVKRGRMPQLANGELKYSRGARGGPTVNRRTFFSAVAAAPALGLIQPRESAAELPNAKVTRVRIYKPPDLNPLFNQSNMVVTVETNIGITGI